MNSNESVWMLAACAEAGPDTHSTRARLQGTLPPYFSAVGQDRISLAILRRSLQAMPFAHRRQLKIPSRLCGTNQLIASSVLRSTAAAFSANVTLLTHSPYEPTKIGVIAEAENDRGRGAEPASCQSKSGIRSLNMVARHRQGRTRRNGSPHIHLKGSCGERKRWIDDCKQRSRERKRTDRNNSILFVEEDWIMKSLSMRMTSRTS